MQKDNNLKTITLDEDFGDVALSANGVRVEILTNGSILAYTNGKVKLCPSANDGQSDAGAILEVGDRMEDGTIYAGISPDTGTAMYVTPADASLTMKWEEAMDYAAGLDAHGQKDWRLPSKAELRVLFENRAKIGGFDESGSDNALWYWSRTAHPDNSSYMYSVQFTDGDDGWVLKDLVELSTRPVRAKLRP